jgi:protein involved in polysaccharide export with SLBB domain
MTKQKQIKGAVHHSPKTMSHNTELTLGQLTQISGGSTREERKEKREKRREEREHKKTCPDGKRTPDCPYPVPEMTASIDLN